MAARASRSRPRRPAPPCRATPDPWEGSMSSEPIKTPRRLLVIALVALTMAGGIATYGIVQRARSAAQVKQWTDAQAIPTVALANVRRGVGERKLTLPGTIQPYYRAAIYARVSGYLKSWQADIGRHVKAGEL